MSLLNLALVFVGPFVAIGVPYVIARKVVHHHAEAYARDVRRVHAPAREKAGVR